MDGVGLSYRLGSGQCGFVSFILMSIWSDLHWQDTWLQDRNVTLTARRFHSELYMWIHCIEKAGKVYPLWFSLTILVALSTSLFHHGQAMGLLWALHSTTCRCLQWQETSEDPLYYIWVMSRTSLLQSAAVGSLVSLSLPKYT